MGYLGGITWTILCYYIYNERQSMTAVDENSHIQNCLCSFFDVFSRWNWRKHSLSFCSYDHAGGALKTSSCVMEIFLPTDTTFNTAHNVTQSSLQVIQKCLAQGFVYAAKISNLNLEERKVNIHQLFTPTQFSYNHWIYITVSADSEINFYYWMNYVQSKLRFLTKSLEALTSVRLAHLDTQLYRVHTAAAAAEKEVMKSKWRLGLDSSANNFDDVQTRLADFLLMLKTKYKKSNIDHMHIACTQNYDPNRCSIDVCDQFSEKPPIINQTNGHRTSQIV